MSKSTMLDNRLNFRLVCCGDICYSLGMKKQKLYKKRIYNEFLSVLCLLGAKHNGVFASELQRAP